MSKSNVLLLCLVLAGGCCIAARVTEQVAASWQFQTATPESQGMSAAKLEALKQSLAARGTKTFLVMRHDRIVGEWYASDFSASKPHYTASLAKMLTGSLSLMLALTDGRLSLDDPVCKYVPQWKEDPQKKIITVRQLATHTSGLEDAEAEKRDVPHNKLTGWKGEFWKTLEPPRDPFTLSRDEARVVFKPGTKFPPGDDAGYSNPGYAMLAYTIAASYRGTPYADLRVLLRDRLMRPIGAGDEEWSVGYKRTFNVDGLPLMATWGGGAYTARAVARVARLLLRNGDWEGKQLLARDSIHQVKPQGPVAPWLRPLPAGSFCGAGAGMQLMIVVPSLDLLAVRNGKDLAENDSDWKSLSPVLFEPLMNAIEK